MRYESPSPCYVLGVVSAVLLGDWELGRWCAREAVMARVAALLDDGAEVDVETLRLARIQARAEERLRAMGYTEPEHGQGQRGGW